MILAVRPAVLAYAKGVRVLVRADVLVVVPVVARVDVQHVLIDGFREGGLAWQNMMKSIRLTSC